MMVELTYQMVLSTIQTAGILAGIAYYIMVLRNQQKNQEISLRNQEISLKNQEETLKTRKYEIYKLIPSFSATPNGTKVAILLQNNSFSSYEEWRELTNTNQEYYQAWLTMCVLYDTVGIMLKEGLITIDMMAHHQPFWALRFWRQNKPIIYKHRERVGPSHYRNMEYYMDSLEKYFEEHPELAP